MFLKVDLLRTRYAVKRLARRMDFERQDAVLILTGRPIRKEFSKEVSPAPEGAIPTTFLEMGCSTGKEGPEKGGRGFAGAEKGGQRRGITKGEEPGVIVAEETRGCIVSGGHDWCAGHQSLPQYRAPSLLRGGVGQQIAGGNQLLCFLCFQGS